MLRGSSLSHHAYRDILAIILVMLVNTLYNYWVFLGVSLHLVLQPCVEEQIVDMRCGRRYDLLVRSFLYEDLR